MEYCSTVLLLDSKNVCLFRTSPIHAEAPEFTDMSVEQEILVTGIKVVDLLAPYAKGGKIGMIRIPSELVLYMLMYPSAPTMHSQVLPATSYFGEWCVKRCNSQLSLLKIIASHLFHVFGFKFKLIV